MGIPARDIEHAEGYIVRYDSAKAGTRVYAMAAIGVGVCVVALFMGSEILIALGLGALATAYYFYPLVEARRARLGANEYGIFIEGFGLVDWRSVRRIELIPTSVRSIILHELQIQLSQPVSRALLVDWRRMPLYRRLMRLPWVITPDDNTIHIELDSFKQSPETVHRTLESIWRHYRGW